MNKRLFLAVDLPFELKQFLVSQQKVIERRNKKIKFISKWTPIENLHITVLFLGKIKAVHCQDLKEELASQLASLPFLEFELFKIALAPPRGRQARMIWAYFTAGRNYLAAVERVRRAADKFISPEVKRDIKPPLPHVTLARFSQPIKQGQLDLQDVEKYRWRAKEIVLWESKLGGRYPVYSQIGSFNLKV